MKYQTVLFDMDGTLLDTLTDMEAAVNHILTQYGYPVRTLGEVRRFVGNGAGLPIHRALPQGGGPRPGGGGAGGVPGVLPGPQLHPDPAL